MAKKNGNGTAPNDPTDVRWGGVIKRTIKEFREDNLTDGAAALTHYAVLAIFPALIALVSILGLLGQPPTNGLIAKLNAIPAGGQAKGIVVNAITNLSQKQSGAGFALISGRAIALWSA